ncbi:sensor histidine kinase [Nocardioides pacificus]
MTRPANPRPAIPGPASLAAAARAFSLLLLATPTVGMWDTAGMVALIGLGAIWLAASGLGATRLRRMPALVVEGCLVAAVCGLFADSSPQLLAALATTPFIAGLIRGGRGLAEVLLAEVVLVVCTVWQSMGQSAGLPTAGQVGQLTTWLGVSLGVGLVAVFIRSTRARGSDALDGYRNARALVLELLELSGDLGPGLDPLSFGNQILSAIHDELPVTSLTLQVPREDGLTPLTLPHPCSPAAAESPAAVALATAALVEQVPRTCGRDFALPLVVDDRAVAVVTGSLAARSDPERLGVERALRSLSHSLTPLVLQLDTALLFVAIRGAGSAGERRRLAREMHDGVAQDVASMGYLVDGLLERPHSTEQADQLRLLRRTISAVVEEVRRTVLALRTETAERESLGEAIAALARHLGDVSSIPVRVSVDEGVTRLRPEVETELLRITQEAMTNAVRHAGASTVEVACHVDPPRAAIVVTDDGNGMGPPRPDSHGLRIMHERARLIGARLDIRDRETGGVVLTVEVPHQVAVS